MEPSDPQTPTIRISVIVGDFFIMNTLTSFFHQVQNDSIFIQHRLRVIHESLLQCLADTAAINKKPDYHRGELHLTKRMQ